MPTEIKKILIANRGEIALRIIRTCKEMGIKTVVLCPMPGQEKDFLETSMADEYYFLDQEGVQGYLNKEKIIEIAKKAKVDAIHPGYGFLSENWKFALYCERNKIRFIGPHFKILNKMEDKVEAKKIAQKIGMPILPASDKPIKNRKDLFKWATRIKSPFVLKAQRGGGGIGIRVINGQISFGDLFAISLGAQKQMAGAFSDMEFFLEKYLPEVKHIEFQIIGDGRNVVHLGERECSIQRRFQKLLEEAPSPFLDEALREKIGRWAVKIGQEMKYQGAATVEFLIDKDKNFYFMEVNPRIQVEHPVTEAITGVDIVEQQIRITQGERISFSQDDVYLNGCAIEARINAEDPQKNFQPCPGKVDHFIAPGGQGVFVHSFLHDGQEIYPYFDSLLAKIIAWGKNRKEAIGKLNRALGETVIDGVATTVPLFKMILKTEEFSSGNFYTNFIEKSNLLKELMLKPYLQKKILAQKTEVLSEKEIADISYEIYKNLKLKGTEQEYKEKEISKWVMAERNNLFQER